jgi:uncharacterized OB-fold protein
MTKILSKAPPTTHFHLATDRWTEPFWEATARHRLEIPRCGDCGLFRMPPSPFCASCQSQNIEWIEVSGAGAVYSFTIITNPPFPEAAEHLPYLPAIIELDGAPGVRLVSALIDAPIDQVEIGSRVDLCWQDMPDGVTLPRFRLSDDTID